MTTYDLYLDRFAPDDHPSEIALERLANELGQTPFSTTVSYLDRVGDYEGFDTLFKDHWSALPAELRDAFDKVFEAEAEKEYERARQDALREPPDSYYDHALD
jgi:hypothetical protein